MDYKSFLSGSINEGVGLKDISPSSDTGHYTWDQLANMYRKYPKDDISIPKNIVSGIQKIMRDAKTDLLKVSNYDGFYVLTGTDNNMRLGRVK